MDDNFSWLLGRLEKLGLEMFIGSNDGDLMTISFTKRDPGASPWGYTKVTNLSFNNRLSEIDLDSLYSWIRRRWADILTEILNKLYEKD